MNLNSNLRRNVLTFLHLTAIPYSALDESTTVLKASNNDISEVDDGLCFLKNLQELYLNHNQITRICGEISTKLAHLTIICLSHNQLTSDALEQAHFERAPLLSILELAYNQLDAFPISLCMAVNLRKITVASNKLTNLPAEFAQFTKLEYLGLDKNEFPEVPSILAQMRHIKGVSFIGNPAKASSVVDLKRLSAVVIGAGGRDSPIKEDIEPLEVAEKRKTPIQWQKTAPRVSLVNRQQMEGDSPQSYRISYTMSLAPEAFKLTPFMPNSSKYPLSLPPTSPLLRDAIEEKN